MSQCNQIVRKCGETKSQSQWERFRNFVTSSKFIGAFSLSALVAGITTRQHNLLWIGASGLTATAGTIYCNSKAHQLALSQATRQSCTTIFDTFRFKPHPLCAKLPRDNPLIFYNNEPAKPVDPEDPWLKNIPYDNVPKPKCCEKPGQCCPKQSVDSVIAGEREVFKSETYNNIPKGAYKCLS